MKAIDTHILTSAYTGLPDECGDLGVMIREGSLCFLALVDGLGHGATAHAIARQAEACLAIHCHLPVADVIKALHTGLKGTRGAVAAVCRLDLDTGILSYSGMGNICLRILGSCPRRLTTRDGILGYMIPTPRQNDTRLLPGDLLVMTSDGIKEHIDMDENPDLFTGSARDVAQKILLNLNKNTDDASCIIVRYGI